MLNLIKNRVGGLLGLLGQILGLDKWKIIGWNEGGVGLGWVEVVVGRIGRCSERATERFLFF